MQTIEIDGYKVVETKMGRYSLNGEFTACFKTAGNRYYVCDCDSGTIRSKREVNKKTFDNYHKTLKYNEIKAKPIGEPKSDPGINRIPSNPNKQNNFFEDTRYFASGKLHKVSKAEVSELALSISNWTVKTSVPKDAILKTFHWMKKRFDGSLTLDEIREFTIDLLNIRSEQFKIAVDGPPPVLVREKPEPLKLPKISVAQAYGGYGVELLFTNEKPGLGRSKLGGFPDLPLGSSIHRSIDKLYFAGQINTHDIEMRNENIPLGMFSFFIDKDFDGTDFFKARKLTVIFTPFETILFKTNKGQEIFDEVYIDFTSLNAGHFTTSDEHILSAQFLPGFQGDEYAECLVERAFGALGAEEAFNSFPTIRNKQEIAMTPLLRLKGHDLRIKGEAWFAGLNTVFFMDLQDFNRKDFTNCYYAVETS